MNTTTTQLSKSCLRIFSGLQPTGIPHLGNYFGALAQWVNIANNRQVSIENKKIVCDKPIYCIVDVHAYCSTNVQFGQNLYNNILSTTASLLASGLNQENCILFRQSDVLEHYYLDNVFDIFITPSQLKRMTHYKDKSKTLKIITNGLLNYPVLQAADILLYKAQIVPVGEDQIEHIQFTRGIAEKFNSLAKQQIFPLPIPFFGHSLHSKRLKSLRNPSAKMSKSDPQKLAFIEIIDEPDVIVEKCKKAITDCTSQLYYDAENRPGVSNLMRIYHLATGKSMEQIETDFEAKETAVFKLDLADILIDKFKSIREEYKRLIEDKQYLEHVLQIGANNATPIAKETVAKVKTVLGSNKKFD